MAEAPDRLRIQFLDNEIDLCNTFLDIAETDPDLAGKALRDGQLGFDTALSFLATVRDAAELKRLTEKLSRLEERLDRLTPSP